MICLHCGYCCLYLDVIILKDYDKEPSEDNALHKRSNEVCPHLVISNGKITCLAHGKKYFVDCPCDQYSQIESKNSFCRTGDFITNSTAKGEKLREAGEKLREAIKKMNIPTI